MKTLIFLNKIVNLKIYVYYRIYYQKSYKVNFIQPRYIDIIKNQMNFFIY